MGRTKITISEVYEELREQKKYGSTSMSKKNCRKQENREEKK
jgi:hypothetical protein